MDLKRRWWRAAFARPHVFMLTWPGATDVRLAAERELRQRGWPPAASPADGDILLIGAPPGDPTDEMVGVADRVWRAVPAPRRRIDVLDPAALADQLDGAAARLGTPGDSVDRSPADEGNAADRPLADEADDRDQLRLDVLHIALGPALPNWPAGLRLRLTVQGDVVAEAGVDTLLPRTADPSRTDDGPSAAVRALDRLTRLFAVAGADRFALQAARARDDLLTGASPAAVTAAVDRLHRHVLSARVLRSMLRRIPATPSHDTGAETDAWQRCLRWLTTAAAAVNGAAEPADGTPALLAPLPSLVVGRDLGEVRLIVAAVAPDLDQLIRTHASLGR